MHQISAHIGIKTEYIVVPFGYNPVVYPFFFALRIADYRFALVLCLIYTFLRLNRSSDSHFTPFYRDDTVYPYL